MNGKNEGMSDKNFGIDVFLFNHWTPNNEEEMSEIIQGILKNSPKGNHPTLLVGM